MILIENIYLRGKLERACDDDDEDVWMLELRKKQNPILHFNQTLNLHDAQKLNVIIISYISDLWKDDLVPGPHHCVLHAMQYCVFDLDHPADGATEIKSSVYINVRGG